MKKSLWVAVAVFSIALLFIIFVGMSFLGGWNNWGWGMMGGWPSGMMHEWGFGSFGWFRIILMWLIPVGFVVLVVLGIVGLVRGLISSRAGEVDPYQMAETQPSPRDILQIRYARGEITREQYLQMLDDLN
ncbi:MAG: SHOCT domain-containing protein [Anaerolineales bacterium]|jgi:putative membrane protein|nr:SHOCT domain-containing protein [Anaerolineales bacterium]